MFLTRNLLMALSFFQTNTKSQVKIYNLTHIHPKSYANSHFNTKIFTNSEKYLGAAFAAVWAADELDVATAVLVASTVPALESLQK
jgi:hypothetical protein